MTTRQQLISDALRKRYADVCNVGRFRAHAFGEMADYVLRLQKQLLARRDFRSWQSPKTWLSCAPDCLAAIRVLAADEELESTPSDAWEDSSFFPELQASSRDPQRRFELLTTRYRHPLNFAATSERQVQEHLLERLMVADRARIERHSLDALDADDLLLKLNLVAINASLTSDLRVLDALNYYYELLPLTWYPKSRHGWLLVTYLALYARALSVCA